MNDDEATLDADGILLSVRRVPHHGMGHPVWTLPLGGGEVRIDAEQLPEPGEGHYITIEVAPEVEMPVGEWRDFRAIDRLCVLAERTGGYLSAGDNIKVGDETLVGRDAMRFLKQMLRRSNEREAALKGVEGYEAADREQIERDTRNRIAAAVAAAIEDAMEGLA